jgi:predicted small lipoprotein YifL
MTRNFLALPVAAALALSLSACGRDEERAATPVNPQLPQTAQAPSKAAGTQNSPEYRDPSIPENPENKDRTKKDTSPPPGTGDPAVRGPGG